MPVACRKELQWVVCFRWACSVVIFSRVLLLAGRRMRVSSSGFVLEVGAVVVCSSHMWFLALTCMLTRCKFQVTRGIGMVLRRCKT